MPNLCHSDTCHWTGVSINSCVSTRSNRIGPVCVCMSVCVFLRAMTDCAPSEPTWPSWDSQIFFIMTPLGIQCKAQEVHQHWDIFIFEKSLTCPHYSKTGVFPGNVYFKNGSFVRNYKSVSKPPENQSLIVPLKKVLHTGTEN